MPASIYYIHIRIGSATHKYEFDIDSGTWHLSSNQREKEYTEETENSTYVAKEAADMLLRLLSATNKIRGKR